MRANLADGVGTDLDPQRSDHPGAYPSESAGRIAAVAFAALLFFPLKDLFDSHPSSLRLGLVFAGVAAFFVVYLWRFVFVRAVPRPTRATWVSLGVVCALVAALVVGDGPQRWAPLFIFVSAIIGVRIGLPWAAYGIGACTLVSVVVLVPTAPLGNALAIALQALAVGALTVGMGRLRVTITELQEAREQLAYLAVTEERLRFARDLHDLLGHSLSVIALKAELAGRLLPAQANRAAKEVADIDAVARSALAEVREAVSGYRQPTLAEAIAAGRLALDAAAIEATWEIAQVVLPHDVDVVLGWAVREAVTNVIRHSRAQQCSVRVTAGLVEAVAEVINDGAGVASETSSGPSDNGADPYQSAGNGLTGLGERVAALRGRLEVGPRPDGGFGLRASVPTSASLPGGGR